MPEEGYTYSQQLGLEFVKSQYGAAVIGALVFPVFGITLSALLAPILAILFPTVTSETKAELEKLTPLQWLMIIVNPGTASFYLIEPYAEEVAQKVVELNLVNQLKAAFGL